MRDGIISLSFVNIVTIGGIAFLTIKAWNMGVTAMNKPTWKV